MQSKKQTRKLWLIIGLFTILRILVSSFLEPGFDEAYYGLYSYNLAPGFYDHPPLVAISAGIGRFITGAATPLTLRLGAILLFAGTCYFLYRLTSQVFDPQAGLIAIFLTNIIPYFTFGMGAFVIPDNFLGFFWVVSLCCLYQILAKQESKYFYLLGLLGGLALLAKYHAVLLIFSIFLSFLLFQDNRRWLKTPFPYISFVIAIIVFLPNIIWNYNHAWISYFYQFSKGARGLKFSGLLFLQGIMVQMGYLLPWHMFILITSLFWAFRNKNPRYNWLLPIAITPILAFTLIGGTRQILPHWPMPGYLTAIILAAGMLQKWRVPKIKPYLISTGVFTILVIMLLAIHAEFGILPLRQKDDVTLDGQGWQELVRHLKNENIITKDRFLFTRKWFLSGELGWALKNQYPVTVFNQSASHSFPFWFDDRQLASKDGIYITTNRYKYDPQKLYTQYFADIIPLDTVHTKRYGQTGKTFYIYKCKKYQGNYPFEYGRSADKR